MLFNECVLSCGRPTRGARLLCRVTQLGPRRICETCLVTSELRHLMPAAPNLISVLLFGGKRG